MAKANREHRNKVQSERRKRNVEGWQALNIDKTIISRFDLRNKNPERVSEDFFKQLKGETKKVRTKRTKEKRQKERREKLINAGYKPKQIKKGWTTSDAKTNALINDIQPEYKVYRSEKYLAISFTSLHGAIVENTSKWKHKTMDELKDYIKERYDEARENIDGYNKLRAAFQIFHGSKEDCKIAQEVYAENGYNLKMGKLDKSRYYGIENRNDWSEREIAELLCCMVDQAPNSQVPAIIKQVKNYCKSAGFPFNDLFEEIG